MSINNSLDEYSLSHEFQNIVTDEDSENMKEAVKYIQLRYNSLPTMGNDQMKNLVTEEHIPNEEIQFSLCCVFLAFCTEKELIEIRIVN